MSQEGDSKKKEPPREKPEADGQALAPKLPPPAEAPTLKEKPAPQPSSPRVMASGAKASGKTAAGDLEAALRSGLVVLLIVAVAALGWMGIRNALKAGSGLPSSGGPEQVARDFLSAVKNARESSLSSAIQWLM